VATFSIRCCNAVANIIPQIGHHRLFFFNSLSVQPSFLKQFQLCSEASPDARCNDSPTTKIQPKLAIKIRPSRINQSSRLKSTRHESRKFLFVGIFPQNITNQTISKNLSSC
jgi:hypothetical protein